MCRHTRVFAVRMNGTVHKSSLSQTSPSAQMYRPTRAFAARIKERQIAIWASNWDLGKVAYCDKDSDKPVQMCILALAWMTHKTVLASTLRFWYCDEGSASLCKWTDSQSIRCSHKGTQNSPFELAREILVRAEGSDETGQIKMSRFVSLRSRIKCTQLEIAVCARNTCDFSAYLIVEEVFIAVLD